VLVAQAQGKGTNSQGMMPNFLIPPRQIEVQPGHQFEVPPCPILFQTGFCRTTFRAKNIIGASRVPAMALKNFGS